MRAGVNIDPFGIVGCIVRLAKTTLSANSVVLVVIFGIPIPNPVNVSLCHNAVRRAPTSFCFYRKSHPLPVISGNNFGERGPWVVRVLVLVPHILIAQPPLQLTPGRALQCRCWAKHRCLRLQMARFATKAVSTLFAHDNPLTENPCFPRFMTMGRLLAAYTLVTRPAALLLFNSILDLLKLAVSIIDRIVGSNKISRQTRNVFGVRNYGVSKLGGCLGRMNESLLNNFSNLPGTFNYPILHPPSWQQQQDLSSSWQCSRFAFR